MKARLGGGGEVHGVSGPVSRSTARSWKRPRLPFDELSAFNRPQRCFSRACGTFGGESKAYQVPSNKTANAHHSVVTHATQPRQSYRSTAEARAPAALSARRSTLPFRVRGSSSTR